MEEEAAALREMQAKVAKEMQGCLLDALFPPYLYDCLRFIMLASALCIYLPIPCDDLTRGVGHQYI
jgi:hypothetical protein